jgi:cyanophycin synthetase
VSRHKLIVITLDLKEYEQLPTNKIPGFLERLKALFPGMYSHRCSEGVPGGFFHRVEEGTWLGHVIEHIALEIQSLAGMEAGFGRTRTTGEDGVYHVVFAYVDENAGRYAARAAVNIALALANGEDYTKLDDDIDAMRDMYLDGKLGPSTEALVEEAQLRGIPYIRLNKHSLVQLGYGSSQKRIQAAVTNQTSNIGVEIAGDKEVTKNLLEFSGIPVPRGVTISTELELESAIEEYGFPLVIKPLDGNHGRGATIDIKNAESALAAFHLAKHHSRNVIVEEYITGHDYRILVVNSKFAAAAKRTPAMVKGDGKSTVQELIDTVNQDPRRGRGHDKELTKIKIDDHTLNLLKEKELTLESVLPQDEILHLKATANLSTGGTAEDVTDIIHPYNIFLAERAASIVGLDICGIDIISPDISVAMNRNKGAVIEVNAGPGLRMHLAPTEGLGRNIAKPIIDMLFPEGSSYRPPIVAVTGTNGKTTTTRLIAHMAKTSGFKTGYTTTEGVYIQDRMVVSGDCTGPLSAEFVFRDPTVEFAVLETARGGILRSGIGFKESDVAIVTNIAADHLGLKGINTLKELARVKSIVAETVHYDGYAILNADDDMVYAMRETLDCNIALFSLNETNDRIQDHLNRGGLAAILENGYVTIQKGKWKTRVARAEDIPLTFRGRALFMVQNILAAVLAAHIQKFDIRKIRTSLNNFVPSAKNTPGRMNVFPFKNFEVMVDYAHNPAGMRAIAEFLKAVNATSKVGIIAGVGDRRDEDIREVGEVAARMFDEIIIRFDRDLRNRSQENILALLKEGIARVGEKRKVKVIEEEMEAIRYAVKNAKIGSVVTICTDNITEALKLVGRLKRRDDRFVVPKPTAPEPSLVPEDSDESAEPDVVGSPE